MAARVLVIEDDPDVGRLVGRVLAREGYGVAVHASAEMGFAALAAEPFDAVVTDVRMDGIDGIEVCRRVTENEGIPVVVITAYGGVDVSRAVLRAGARELVQKPFTAAELCDRVRRALAGPRLERNPRLGLRDPPVAATGLLGSSPAFRRVLSELPCVARSDATVLLVGESGTGKEHVARAVHETSGRRNEPFVAVHCGAIPETLLEAELFGHEKGAFTGAHRARQGLFLEAGRGTIFLDDVSALPLDLQPKLLRALQGRTVRAVGKNVEVPFDARIVAATSCDLGLEAVAGRFRADLLHRLDVLRVDVPPLRARGGDVVELALAFLAEIGSGRSLALSRAAEAQLMRYPWPGNVRELRNCIEAAAALATSDTIELADLPIAVRTHRPELGIVDASEGDTLVAVERRHVARVLAAVGGNRSAAADVLGLTRQALYRKLRRLGVD